MPLVANGGCAAITESDNEYSLAKSSDVEAPISDALEEFCSQWVAANQFPDDQKGQANIVYTEFFDFFGPGLCFGSGRLCEERFRAG